MVKFKEPGPSERIAVIGASGSGKTVAALYHLSKANLAARPWVVFDFKDDENIARIDKAQHVGLDWRPERDTRGIFVVHPMRTEDDQVNSMMIDLLRRGNVGIYVDEPDMNRATGFEDALRKGRSHNVPVIALTQRPVDCNVYLLSEASFIQVFMLSGERDWRKVNEYINVPDLESIGRRLKKYHSLYYNVGEQSLIEDADPVPPVERILAEIDRKLTPKQETVLLPNSPEKRKRVLV